MSRFRAIGLTAFALAVVPQPLPAGITLTERYSDATAFADVPPESDHPAPRIQTDFLPANLSISAAATSNGSTATANSTSISSINLDSATNSLNVVGHGTSSATSSDFRGSGMATAQVIRLNFSLSDVSYTWSLTGQLSAGINANDFLQVQLVDESTLGVLFLKSAGQGFADHVNLSGSGALPPGGYKVQVIVVSQTVTHDGVPSNARADFNFTVQGGTPTPTPTPTNEIHWINPDGGSFDIATNWLPQTVPGMNDVAIFDVETSFMNVQANNNTVHRLEIEHADILALSGSIQSGDLAVNGGSTLLLQNGATLSTTGPFATISDNANIQMHGTGTRWTNTSAVAVQIGGVEPGNGVTPGRVSVDQNAVFDAQTGIALGLPNVLQAGRSGTLLVENTGHAQTSNCTINNGELLIADGGSMHLNNSVTVFQGGIHVTGEGAASSRLDVDGILDVGGLFGSGGIETGVTSVLIDGGGTVRLTDGNVGVGNLNQRAPATLTISGVGPSGQPSSLIVGGTSGLSVAGAMGTQVEVTDGGLLSIFAIGIGFGGTARVLVNGTNGLQHSTLIADQVSVDGGQSTPSELVVRDGGRVMLANRLLMGALPGELGRTAVSGSDSSVSAGHVLVGVEGDGELLIADGARVSSTGGTVGFSPTIGSALGAVTIEGTLFSSSEWQVTGDCTVGQGEPGTVKLMGTAILGNSVGGATLTVSGTLTVNTPGRVIGNGKLSVGTRVVNGGLIDPGLSPGVLEIDGDYEQTDTGTLRVEAASLDPGQMDLLHVTGHTTLGGTLDVRFLNNYLPRAGDVLPFLKLDGGVTGNLVRTIFPQLLPGFDVTAELVNGTYQLTALNDAVLAPTFLLNISTRIPVNTDDNALIGGFILQGAGPKTVMIRAIGPSLGSAGVTGALINPTLELHDESGALIGQNDNWPLTQIGGVITQDQAAEIQASSIAPSSSAESAIIATLNPGAYTAIVRGTDNSTGIGLAEIFDLSQNVPARLGNISTRGFVQTGDNVMIGGFIIGNQETRVIVRAIGPSLADFGVQDALPDPTLELRDSSGMLLASNDNWKDTQRAEIKATGIPPANDLESAVVATLAPGAYTAVVRGKDNTTGVGLVEVYDLH